MLDRYVHILKNAGIVAFPTETVYGLGADAWNTTAVQKVFDQKGRPADNPLIVHVASEDMIPQFAKTVSDDAQKLMDHFWPGPLTLIFEKEEDVLDIVTAGLDTVALRWPMHPLSQDLIARTGPLVAPSANSSGRPSPTRPEHVLEDFGDDFPVVRAGETNIGLESTVLDVSAKPYQIYRPGAISTEDIGEVITTKVNETTSQPKEDAAAKSPGTKYSHYSPDAAVRWLEKDANLSDPETLYLLHNKSANSSDSNVIHYKQDYEQMAHELYDRFRQADRNNYTAVAVERINDDTPSNSHITIALINRISKAIG